MWVEHIHDHINLFVIRPDDGWKSKTDSNDSNDAFGINPCKSVLPENANGLIRVKNIF